MKIRYFCAAFALVIAVIHLSSTTTPAQKGRKVQPQKQTVRIEITRYGYEPASIALNRNVPTTITFRRTVESTCATEVVFADYGISRSLPLNEDVVVSFTPRKIGEFVFTCGMNMHRGRLIVR